MLSKCKSVVDMVTKMCYSIDNALKGSFRFRSILESIRLVKGCVEVAICRPGVCFLKASREARECPL